MRRWTCEGAGLPNLRIIRNQQNQGAAQARSIALDATAQPFVVFLDSDDFLGEDALDRLIASLQKVSATLLCSDW